MDPKPVDVPVKKIALMVIAISLLLLIPGALRADPERGGVKTRISVNLGVERLEFEEDASDLNLSSHSTMRNIILGVEGIKRWDHVFAGIKTVIPVNAEEVEETWTRAGQTFQINQLHINWTRADSYIGYPLKTWLTPYAGLRWSQNEQERKNFLTLGNPVAGTIKETITSWSFLIGVRGNEHFKDRWNLLYAIEYFLPAYVKVVNSSTPGFEARNKDGYTLEAKAGLEYAYLESLSFGFQVFAGKMHWNGSERTPFWGGFVLWPANDTTYLGGTLSITLNF